MRCCQRDDVLGGGGRQAEKKKREGGEIREISRMEGDESQGLGTTGKAFWAEGD